MSTDLSAAISAAKNQIRIGDFLAARTVINKILDELPENIEALYISAVCERKLGHQERALELLEQLQKHQPSHSHALQECGYNLQELGQLDAATQAFEQAVALNPAMHGAWNALSQLPNYPRRTQAIQQTQWLQSLPAQLVSVSSLIHQNKLHKAETLCRQFLQQQPHHPEAMRLLAELGVKFKILDDAEVLLEKCLEFKPDYQRARLDYVEVLQRRQKFDQALEQARILFEIDPNPSFEVSLGNAFHAVGNYQEAIRSYRNVIMQQVDNSSVHVALGHALKTSGDVGAAVNAYQSAYVSQAGFGDAYWSLANLKTYQFSQDEIDAMLLHENSSQTRKLDRIQLCFALGKAFEDRDEYARSFDFYRRGNELQSLELKYDSRLIKDGLDFQKKHFDKVFFSQRKSFGNDAPDPIFIVGLPRAGSTLLEQILASHSQVDGTMELANVISMAHRLNGRQGAHDSPRYPSVLLDMPQQGFANLGQAYIDETRGHRQGGAFFIDKMPNNFRHIGLIQLMLPNAKIIDARRDPFACCFSGFKQLFAEGQEFSYSLHTIGDYYCDYVDVMRHWDQVLPGRILRVQHEDVILDLETQVRRILDYCGLPFEQACLEFHKNKRAVRTPSSEQVRQPIYASGMDQWRHYETYLEPLKRALSPVL